MLDHFEIFGEASLSILHVALATAVAVHALQTKRDVPAAIGWIGLAVLSPIVGSVLYFTFGINRVRRRARRLRDEGQGGEWPSGGRQERQSAGRAAGAPPQKERRKRDRGRDARDTADAPAPGRGDHLDGLLRAAGQITGRPPLPGNRVTMLFAGDEAYPRMVAAIDAAERSVALSSYILSTDAAGSEFVDALARAAGRGVAVRVLIDGIGGGYFLSSAYHALRRAGVPAARFLHSPLPWRMPFLNMRTHKKVLVADGRLGFAGGLNIAGENRLADRPAHPVRDTHFAFEGPVVVQLLEAFTEDWEFATGETLDGPAWAPATEAAADGAMARVVTSGPDEDLEKVEFLVLQAVASARERILIKTPYFLPDERLITGLSLAAMRGVAVDIVIPAHSNRRIVDWATRAEIGPLLESGCRLWAAPAPFDHSKLMTIDGLWSLVGSANWDIRSFRLNFELDIEIYDAALAGRIEARIREAHNAPIALDALDRRSLPLRLRDAAARLLLPYL